MYEETVERLRNCTSDTVEDCAGCPYQGGFNGTYCMNGLISEAANVIEELVGKVEQLTRWISVTERLPEAGERVLCYCRANIYEVMKMRTDGDWVCDTNHVYMHSFVTHWMPLPKWPEDGNDA